MLIKLAVISIATSTIALLYARWEYARRGKLSLLGLLLLCAMLFIPNLMLHYVFDYKLPTTALDYLGVLTGLTGLVLCLWGLFNFQSLAKTLCLDAGGLTTSGTYRWGRNPQYVGWLLFLLGFALNDWSQWCLAALLIVAVSLHVLVLIEEQHLRHVFGAPYEEFCRKTARYWSSRFLNNASAASDK